MATRVLDASPHPARLARFMERHSIAKLAAQLGLEMAVSADPGASRDASDEVLDLLGTGPAGLSAAEAEARLGSFGPNAVRTHHASALSVLIRQLRSALLLLLIAAAVVSRS